MPKLVDDATLIMDVVTQLPSFFRKAKSQSLIEFGQPARNDFLTLIENDLVGLPYMNDIMQSVHAMISMYFLNGITLLMDIPGVDIIGKLDQLNSKRDPIDGILGTASGLAKYVGTEGFEHGLPTHGSYTLSDASIALEAYKGKASDSNKEGGSSSISFGGNNSKVISELSNLSVGKMLEVVFEKDGNKAVVNVIIRLAVTNTDAESMKTILTIGGSNNTMKERWLRMKAGELKFVKDLLFCNDIIEESMKTRIRDKSKFYEHMMKRRTGNFITGMLSMRPSINNASGVIGITTETAKSIRGHLGGELEDFKVREKWFKSTSAMILFVVDRKWEMVTFYHRSIDGASELTLRDLKRAGSGQGIDVDDILRAYSAGNAPAL